MRIITVTWLILASMVSHIVHGQKVKMELQHFFLEMPFDTDLSTIKKYLAQTNYIVFYNDPNLNELASLSGRATKNKCLDTASSRNRFIVLFKNVKAKNADVSIKWAFDYNQADLALAEVEFEKLKSTFLPYFVEFRETEKIGQGQEQILTHTMYEERMEVIIQLVRYNNTTHTVSLEYEDKWQLN